MSQPSVNIDTLHAAILSDLSYQFPTCSVNFYPRPGERIVTPAILLEIEDIAVDDPDDIGTEQVPVVINLNAYAVLDYKAGKKQAVKSLAASIITFLHGKRWGTPVGAAKVVGASPDVIQGKEDEYEVMRVEFSHTGLLGADIWTDEGTVPSEIYLGISPLIGPENIEYYRLVNELPETT